MRTEKRIRRMVSLMRAHNRALVVAARRADAWENTVSVNRRMGATWTAMSRIDYLEFPYAP